MSEKHILGIAIDTARDNGWRHSDFPIEVGVDKCLTPWWENHYPLLIFNHDFAKALWGETLVANRDINEDEYISLTTSASHTTRDIIPAYKFHLQEMVIADDPIKYLAEHLEG